MIAFVFEVWVHEAHRQDYLDTAADLRPLLEGNGYTSVAVGNQFTEDVPTIWCGSRARRRTSWPRYKKHDRFLKPSF